MDVDGRVHGGRIGRGICSIDGGCTGYVSDSGGPNKIDTTKNGREGPLLLLVVVSVEPARSANELVAPNIDGDGPLLEGMMPCLLASQ